MKSFAADIGMQREDGWVGVGVGVGVGVHVRSSPSARRRYTQLLRYSTHQAAREQRPRRSRNELIQGPLSNLRVLTAHASACSMKVSSRVPQGDQQTVLHSGDAAQSVPVDMGVGWLTAQFLWYQTVSTDATELL